jgi:hypothetical protein
LTRPAYREEKKIYSAMGSCIDERCGFNSGREGSGFGRIAKTMVPALLDFLNPELLKPET